MCSNKSISILSETVSYSKCHKENQEILIKQKYCNEDNNQNKLLNSQTNYLSNLHEALNQHCCFIAITFKGNSCSHF